MSKKTEAPQRTETRYTKAQILNSKRYRNDKDLISLLEDKEYTLTEVDKALEQIKKKEVKVC